MQYIKKYELNKYEKPINKDVRNLDKDDVVTFEFGDYDNWVVGIVTDYKVKPDKNGFKSKILEITFESLFGYKEKCYSFIYSEKDYLIRVIGKASECEKDQNDSNNNEL